MSLRIRLVLVAAAAVAASVALASVIVFFLVRNELRGQVDRNLTSQAQQVTRFPLLPSPIAPKQYALHVRGAPFSSPFQIVDRDGNLYRPQVGFETIQAPLPGINRAREVARGTRNDFYFEAPVFGKDARVFVSKIGPGYAVEVAAPLASVNNELAKIRLWLLLVGCGGIGIASIAGFLVARAALAPVRELSDTAERVRKTRDLSQRINIGGSDELSRLASTFNGMLESLDEAAGRQRRLVQDASHELRTPLTSLRTNIELLATRGDELPPDERQQLLHDVVEQLGEMTLLIGELTELARGEDQDPRTRSCASTSSPRRRSGGQRATTPRCRSSPTSTRRPWSARPRTSSVRSATCSTTPPSGARPASRSSCDSQTVN